MNLVVKKDISLSFHRTQIILKFLLYQLMGVAFSLSFCPQFGVGMNPAVDISHYFMQFGDWACAIFCGSLFLGTGLLVSFLGMKGEELWWIWRRYKFPLIFLPAILWAALMLTNKTLSLPGETLIFHLFWLVSAILTIGIFLTIRGRIFEAFQLEPRS
jgi:hypothetical protein